MAELLVTKHAEGGANNVDVKVHGVSVVFADNEGVAESHGTAAWVRFKFSGPEGARLRVQIRAQGQIVYREEAQIPMSQTSHDSCDRYFRLSSVSMVEDQTQVA